MSEYLTQNTSQTLKSRKLFGSNLSKFSEYLSNITNEDIKLLDNEKLMLNFDGEEVLISLHML
jgi:hypothetical protein